MAVEYIRSNKKQPEAGLSTAPPFVARKEHVVRISLSGGPSEAFVSCVLACQYLYFAIFSPIAFHASPQQPFLAYALQCMCVRAEEPVRLGGVRGVLLCPPGCDAFCRRRHSLTFSGRSNFSRATVNTRHVQQGSTRSGRLRRHRLTISPERSAKIFMYISRHDT